MKLKLNIRRRLMLIVLSSSLVTLVILSGVAFYGMNGVRNIALESAEEIGTQSALNSSGTLEMQKKKELSLLATDKSEAINYQLTALGVEVKKIADEMTYINANPDKFSSQYVPPPAEVFDHEIAFYIRHGSSFNIDWFRAEVERTSNIRDFLIRSVETNALAVSMAVASRYNFTLIADDNHEVSPDERQVPPLIYEALESDWYTRALNEGTLIFTEVRPFESQHTIKLFCAAPYFEPDGEIAGVVCAEASLKLIARFVSEVSMHDEGFCFLVDERGRMILSSDPKNQSGAHLDLDLRTLDNAELADIAVQMVDGFKGIREATYGDKKYFISYSPIDRTDWSFGVALDASALNEPILNSVDIIKNLTQKNIAELDRRMINTMEFFGAFIIVLMASTAWIGRRLSEHFVEPIHQLSDGVREISTGDLNKKLEIKTGDEIESLAVSFNAMTSELQTYIANLTRVTADKERIATELNVASNIQQAMLPNIFPPFPDRREFDLYATMHAAKEVGGDFYDFYLLDDDHLMVTIADVSGKGVPAALFMVISKTILKNCALAPDSTENPALVLMRANRQLSQNNDEFMFVTMFAAVIDLKTGRMIYVNGGHNPPLVRRNGRYEYLKLERSCALGINELVTFEQKSLTLEAGDVLFLYTDGVTEAMDVEGNQYSDERLLDRLNALDGSSTVEEIISSVSADLKAHVSGAEQSDDVTMLALKINFLDGAAD